MIEVQVHIPDPTPPAERVAIRLRQQISDAAGGTNVEAFEFAVETYQNLVAIHGL